MQHDVAPQPSGTGGNRPFANLSPGDPAPDFIAASARNPRFVFGSAAGRYLVLCFFGSASDPAAAEAIRLALASRAVFNDEHASFFGVSLDPADREGGRVQDAVPGARFLFDPDGAVAKLYGVLPRDATGDGPQPMRRLWFVIDPTLRVLRVFPFTPQGAGTADVLAYVAGLPPPDRFAGVPLQAPVLFLPNVFEPEFCARLIALYDEKGGFDSGFMREVDGRTVGVTDHSHKRRRDCMVEDPALVQATQARIMRRVLPEIAKVHQFHVTRMERYLIGCYTAEDGGHFAPHRDNTTSGTAHRRFAVSINLNEDFEGGEVSFPEYGRRSFKPPTGGAVVFSCSLLHAVSRVTRGRRYAFLPFLYDDAAAALRQANLRFVETAAAGS